MNRMWIGMLCVLWPLAASGQNIQLSDGTIAVKAVIYDSTGASGAFSTEATALLMRADTAAMAASLDAIEAALSVDAVHDNAALTTGPQLMGECDDVSTDAVDEGDAGKVRVDCTTRALLTRTVDPCTGAKTFHVVNMNTAATVEIANAVSAQFFYICAVNLSATGAQTVAIGEDDTDGCGSITAGLHGGATAATGWSFAANGGIALGSGTGTMMKTATAARYLCIITGSAVQLSGTIAYVSAP